MFADLTIEVTTGPEDNMCTTNEVSLVLYGEKKHSGPLVLGNDFVSGECQKSQVSGCDLVYDLFQKLL